MKKPLPEWGPAEIQARKALNCLRYEVAEDIANDVIGHCIAAFQEIRLSTEKQRHELLSTSEPIS